MILHICCNLAGSTVFPQLFEALDELGIDQQVFVPEKHASNIGKNKPRRVTTVQKITVKQSDALLFFRKAQRSVPTILKEMRLEQCRLIHAHTLFTDGSIALALSKKAGIPYGITLRYSDTEVLWRLPWLRPLARSVLRDASFAVFLGSTVRERVLDRWVNGEEREKLRRKSCVIPNGISPVWLDGRARSECSKPVRVGFAGRLTARKQPLQSLEAVHLADAGNTQHFIWKGCGDGPMKERILSSLKQDDILTGPLHGVDAMKAFYEDIDILLVPSRAETFGMVYLEAMSRGVPVLYTRGQGFDGLFPEGSVGFPVSCGNTKEMAAKLAEISSGDYRAMSLHCVEAASECAWPVIAERWKELYGSVLDDAERES